MTCSSDRTCPLCGGDNECGAARGSATCWCYTATVDAGMQASVAPALAGEACWCPACARGEAPSPCIGVCQLDAVAQTCRGCARTMPEIAAWPTLAAAGKLAILRRIAALRNGGVLPPRHQ